MTLVKIDRAGLSLTKIRDGWHAELRAKGFGWAGTGTTIVAAIESALDGLKRERRTYSKGRVKERYRIAQSILSSQD